MTHPKPDMPEDIILCGSAVTINDSITIRMAISGDHGIITGNHCKYRRVDAPPQPSADDALLAALKEIANSQMVYAVNIAKKAIEQHEASK